MATFVSPQINTGEKLGFLFFLKNSKGTFLRHEKKLCALESIPPLWSLQNTEKNSIFLSLLLHAIRHQKNGILLALHSSISGGGDLQFFPPEAVGFHSCGDAMLKREGEKKRHALGFPDG